MHLTLRLALSALVVLAAAAPSTGMAQSKAPSAMDVKEFDRLFGNFQRDIEGQVAKGQIYPETVKRGRTAIGTVIGYIRKSGADPAPFEQKLEAYIADAERRAGASKTAAQQGNISTEVPRVEPMVGIDAIGPMAPTWCEVYDRELGADKGSAKELRIPTMASQITLATLQEAGTFSCGQKDFAPVQQWTAAWRQTASNLLGLTEAQNAELLVFAASQYQKPQRLTYAEETALKNNPPKTVCDSFPSVQSGLLEAQVSRNLERQVLLCGSTGRERDFELKGLALTFAEDRYPFWLVDVGSGPTTELAKLGLVYRLLTSHRVQESELYAPHTASNPSRVIENHALARTVQRDPAKLRAEVDALALSEPLKQTLKLRIQAAERALAIVDAFAREAASGNPSIQAVFFDGPERGLESYRTQVAGAAGTLDLVLAVEDKFTGTPGGMDGCAEQLYTRLDPWLKGRMKADGLKDPADVRFDDLAGSHLLYGLIACGRNDATTVALADTLKDAYFDRTNLQRGPLSAAYQGMLDAYSEVKANPPAASFSSQRGATSSKVELQQIFWNPVAPPAFGHAVVKHTLQPEQRGVIASVAPANGGRVKITFKTESYSSPIRDCVETGRYDRIDDNGRLVPAYNCRTTGYETLTRTNEPVEMPAWVAKGLVAGQLLVYRGTRPDDGTSHAWPLASYKSKSGTELASLLGVPKP